MFSSTSDGSSARRSTFSMANRIGGMTPSVKIRDLSKAVASSASHAVTPAPIRVPRGQSSPGERSNSNQ